MAEKKTEERKVSAKAKVVEHIFVVGWGIQPKTLLQNKWLLFKMSTDCHLGLATDLIPICSGREMPAGCKHINILTVH